MLPQCARQSTLGMVVLVLLVVVLEVVLVVVVVVVLPLLLKMEIPRLVPVYTSAVLQLKFVTKSQ
jgi:hypothetical protein